MNNDIDESWAQNSLIPGGKHNHLGKTSNIKDLNKPDIQKYFWKIKFCGKKSSRQWQQVVAKSDINTPPPTHTDQYPGL